MDPRTWDAPLEVIVVALWVIVMARANGTYWLGRLAARGAESTRIQRLMRSPGYTRAVDRLNRWGAPVVALSFLTIGVQTLVNLAAGGIRMPLRRYLPAVAVGCVAWAFIYGTVGFMGWVGLQELWARSPAAVIVVGVVGVGALAWAVLSRDKKPTPAG